ncbi:unnamed protein product [Clonostachys rosea f. rosea IK726]|uniref:Uncharacterized protein n=1 Tax=Clonostachys rosea f. rosea IK726 TaxID=1349383 RepID=A0ACA9UPS3_BIOOC|nr:unnamed protein product [Clonostachys rosea f. rosea IK726]
MPEKLSGKVALVTGGGSGFGAAISRLFADEGAKVFIGDISLKGAEEIANAYTGSVIAGQLDVTKRPDWDAAVARVKKEFGQLDILINNAGTSYKNKPTLDVTESEYNLTFNVNSFEGKGGVCVNISSVGADRPRRGLVWYNASKGAVSHASKGLALEYGPHNIRVNSICPLLSGTGLFEAFAGVPDTPENRQQFLANVPLGRLAEGDDIAKAALFLCSEDAHFITGVNLPVDGGRGV